MNPGDGTIDPLLEQAFGHQQAGRLAEAERLYREILRIEPRQPEANHNLGRIELESGRGEEALAHLKAALEADPSVAQSWLSYTDALIRTSRPDDARQVLDDGKRRGLTGSAVLILERRIAELVAAPVLPSVPIKAIVLDKGAPQSAGLATGDAATHPDEIEALQELLDRQRFPEVQGRARSVTLRFPQDPEGWKLLGAALQGEGRGAEAIAPLTTAVRLAPGDASAALTLAMALEDAGRLHEAEAQFRAVLRLRPDAADAHNDLGVLLQRSRRFAEAEASLREALRLCPRFFGALNNLGLLLQDTGRLLESEACFREALGIEPNFAAAHSNLGRVYQSLGRLAEADASFGRALQLEPDFAEAHSNLLFNHCYRAHLSPQACLEEARQYGQRVSARVQERYSSWLASAEPQPLRVGLVSGDLRQHPVGHFLDGLLAQLDRSRLEVFAYPTHHHSDALTQRVRAHCAGWTPLYGHGDAQAARLIHADGIHVLIDLSGHTAHNRLPVFAYKPAPVQVSWLGYFATTGVAEIDYLLADPVSVPPAHHGHFSETIWYLPDTRLCFTPPQDAPAVAPLPALANGFVTFGSFQNLAKLNDAVLALWARVLAALPAARLRLQNKQLADAAVRQQLGQRLQDVGIAADRVSMQGSAPREAYLVAHGEVDLILDTFPFPGGTTTCEALWMGVPTLTLAGDRLIGRQGASLLAAAGLREWIAETPAEYVDKALAFARDLPALAALRGRLRAQVLASPLFDAPRFARNLEIALREMWQRGPRAA